MRHPLAALCRPLRAANDPLILERAVGGPDAHRTNGGAGGDRRGAGRDAEALHTAAVDMESHGVMGDNPVQITIRLSCGDGERNPSRVSSTQVCTISAYSNDEYLVV